MRTQPATIGQQEKEKKSTRMSKLSDMGFIYKKHKIAEVGSSSGFVLCSPAASMAMEAVHTRKRGDSK